MTLDTHNDIEPGEFHRRAQLHAGARQSGQPAEDVRGRPRCIFLHRLCRPGTAHPEGYDNAYKQAVAKFDAIHRLTEEIAPDKIGLALTAADARRIYKSGRKVAFIGVENGYPLGEDLGRLKEFYDRGARYMSLAHNGHSQLADSNTGERDGWKWNGLSPLGRKAVAEMNRLGIMIDVSHPSKESMMQTLQLTKAPIIASHSAVRKLCDNSRNMDDEQLLALKKNGGVIQIVAFNAYVKTAAAGLARARRRPRGSSLPQGTPLGGRGGRGGGRRRARGRGGGGGRWRPAGALADGRASVGRQRAGAHENGRLQKSRRVNAKFPPPPRATVKDFVDHIDYAVKLIGVEHVGISSDFDGGGGVDGWNGADETFNVTLELVRRGYTEDQIAKIWSGNLLRVMDEVQAVARKKPQ